MSSTTQSLNSAIILPETRSGAPLEGWPASPKKLYTFDPSKSTWINRTPVTHAPTYPVPIMSLAVATWNVDFMAAYEKSRLKSALDLLQALVTPLLVPCIVLIQEMHDNCFNTLLGHSFVREWYDVTDVSSYSWENFTSNYGTVTLVPRVLAENVVSVFRTKFRGSKMGREALFVDLAVPTEARAANLTDPTGSKQEAQNEALKILRIANVHLESLRGSSDAARVRQLASVASFLSASKIHAGLVGGDMNPIAPSDPGLPTRLGLLDAWVECHAPPTNVSPEERKEKRQAVEDDGFISRGGEAYDDPAGHTWGYQPTNRFPPRRMDKVLFVGGLKAEKIEKIGVGLKVVPETGDDEEEEEEEEEAQEMERSPVWVSDHYGLLARFQVQPT
ncbi:hypothetical protein NLJ89_g9658 [Agrocybe chaxingu]|uniref:Endonuclease/exonuclease/phosphatase domain-containing protein n=1 Tax=Agrocybe chaxingu TaxID=84603 RepID=A0A9W8JT59_9AGAR|nr:hypothetical protein NLJ89_g9658 [Agrocybe chaxingu]